MQGIMETIFDIAYLGTVIPLGLLMLLKSKDNKQFRLFGLMAVILGCGDAFHLIPRAYGLLTIGLEANAPALGFGKLVTSITMTIFYLILYHFWRMRYNIKDKTILTITVYLLGLVRIALCLFPQNDWFSTASPLSWGIYRNIPFTILGIVMIYIFYIEAAKNKDKVFRFAWLAIILSFALYIPVVLWSDTIPLIGILMIPKTLAYVWIVVMGFREFRKTINKI